MLLLSSITLFFIQHPDSLIVTGFIFGLLVGSFLNVVIYRLPVMLKQEWREQCESFFESEPDISAKITSQNDPQQKFNLAVPRSSCPHCGHFITALENIPVLSYLFLRGRCSSCKVNISPRYPIVEFFTAVLSAVVVAYFGFTWISLAMLFLTWCLIALSLIDYDTQYLPDNITLPLLWCGLLFSLYNPAVTPVNAIIGAAAGYLSLWSVFQCFKFFTGKEGMGFGDFKLLAVLGAWLGWKYLLLIIILSSLVGAVLGILLIIMKGRDKNIPIPFGPYLAAAGWICMIWGDTIIDRYLKISGIS
ncbi:Leader peptidase (Prepilin peptidase) / N-methyltransferase [hydrothermal vent metagenome]|uniref:Leader peptidase (Prepilin peptidase) / N-methyltransferase n=1 Tax=hydrothermal vent metagenome TaxID=652676 RepID=A0A3B0YAH8_9ZZZZ